MLNVSFALFCQLSSMKASSERPRSCGDTADLQRGLLRKAEQKVGESGARVAGDLRAARRIETGERERPARIRVHLAVAAIEPKVAADAKLVLADGCASTCRPSPMRVSVRREAAALCTPVKPAIDRFGTPQFMRTRARSRERRIVDAGEPGDVLNAGKAVGKCRRRACDVDGEVVDRSTPRDVQRQRHGQLVAVLSPPSAGNTLAVSLLVCRTCSCACSMIVVGRLPRRGRHVRPDLRHARRHPAASRTARRPPPSPPRTFCAIVGDRFCVSRRLKASEASAPWTTYGSCSTCRAGSASG